MESSKPILPEDQGTFFIQVKEALATCEYLLHNYSKPAAIDFLKKHVALWT